MNASSKTLCLLALALFASPVLAADVGVSISLGQPGFYGQIDIGGAPPPRILYRSPIIVEQRVVVSEPPVYLRVRPGHARRWKQHCHEYNACGRRVYFVHHDWYNQVYAPNYRERHGHRDIDERDDHDDDREHDDDDDDNRDHDGNHKGKRRGKGHGKNKG